MPRYSKIYLMVIIVLFLGLIVLGCRVQNPFYLEDEVFNVEGRVVCEGGEGIERVRIDISDHDEVYTDVDGVWRKESLKGTVVFTPHKDNMTFHPESREANEESTDLDFIAQVETYRISGTVSDETRGIENVEISFSGGYSSVFTDSQGYWERDGLFEEVEVTPERVGWEFTPVRRNVSSERDDVDFDATYKVSGTVLDDANNSVSKVKISINGDEVYSDEDGYWEMYGLSGEVTIIPAKEDREFTPAEIVVNGHRSNLRFYADVETYGISGTVSDGTRGIENVEISFSGDHPSVVTDSQGNWERDGLFEEVEVTPERVGWEFTPVRRNVSSERDDVDFDATYKVSGTVLDDANNPVSKVKISINGDEVYSDEDGYWERYGLSGEVTIVPTKTGMTFRPDSIVVNGYSPNLEFYAEFERFTLSGRVYDYDGVDERGIEGVEIQFSGEHSSVLTGGDGTWEKTGLYSEVEITPEKAGWEFFPESRIRAEDDVDVDFEATYKVEGRVLDQIGEPLEGVEISFSGEHSSVYTGIDGYWDRDGLAGSVTVTPSKEEIIFKPDEIKVDGYKSDLRFYASYTLSGVVTRKLHGSIEDGEPVPSVKITITNEDGEEFIAITKDDGTWSKSEIHGTVDIVAEKSGFTFDPPSRTKSSEADDVDFVAIQEPFTLSGEVTHADDGSPIPIVLITITNVDTGKEFITYTEDDGTWSKSGIIGDVTIVPTLEGYSFDPPQRYKSEEADDVDFIASPITYPLSGEVTHADDGSPVPGVLITITNIDTGKEFITYTRDDGTWSKSGIHGDVLIVPTLEDYSFEPTQRYRFEEAHDVDFTASPTP